MSKPLGKPDRIVVALGGNALGNNPVEQIEAVSNTAHALLGLIEQGNEIIITHGNGPQVGLLALQGAAYKPDEAYPLDVLGAETGGMIGYMIEQELENALGHSRPVATLLTQVIVDGTDPAFGKPTKFIGPVYEREEAEARARAAGWSIAPDGDKWRRVVPSPVPKEVPDIRVLQLLLERDVIVICTGGGGIPVLRQRDGSMTGIEAVIDKDAASALLACQLGADALLLLTDVDAVYRDFGTPTEAVIASLTPDEARALDLPAGSMGPKMTAAADFADQGGLAGVGRLDQAVEILERRAGTRVRNGD